MDPFVINAPGFIHVVALMIDRYVNTNLYFLVRKQGGGTENFHSKRDLGFSKIPFLLTFFHRSLTFNTINAMFFDERTSAFMEDDTNRPHTPKHYAVAKLLNPGIWDEKHDEHILWCIWANRVFRKSDTYFGVQFWFEREEALNKADTILKTLKVMENVGE